MKRQLKENIIFIMVAHAVFLAEPTLVHAEGENYHPINFTQPLNIARGQIIPAGDQAIYLNDNETCDLFVKNNGWTRDECAGIDKAIFFLTPRIDNVIFEKPNLDGYVKMDDWESGNRDEDIQNLTDSFKEGLKAQSQKLNQKIEFSKWLLYPHLDKSKNVLYYAILVDWGGKPVVNIKASIFDRYGRRTITAVPSDAVSSEQEVKAVVDDFVSSYKPTVGNSYAEFTSGDKVAAYGAMSGLAGLMGVKYGKAATAGIIAVALAFLKKLGFLLLLPFIWLGRLFKRTK